MLTYSIGRSLGVEGVISEKFVHFLSCNCFLELIDQNTRETEIPL